MKTPQQQTLWRWICLRVLTLAIGSVVLIAFSMWLRFVIQNLWVLHHMPPAKRREFALLLEHPERDLARFHHLMDTGWGISYSAPNVASADWLMLGVLVVIAIPFIVLLGLRSARPLSLQFSRLATAAGAIARGEFSTRVGIVDKAPAELARFTRNFNTMTHQLERYDRELRASHVAMAHELRSPLTAAIGRLQGMIDGVFKPEPAQLQMVMKQLVLLNTLTDELHLLSLADAGRLLLTHNELDLVELLQERAAWLKPQAGAAGMAIAISPSSPVPFKGDSFRLGQVFTIIMENALRYACEGKRLEVAVSRRPEACEITFRDWGPGVTEAFLLTMFERFTRAESSRARHSGGSGLGLSIARAVCEACGGTVYASLPAGGGLQITLLLPVTIADADKKSET
ncbi:ATP-binding protein [Erwinia tasmaniensis]|uniref:ATP-binding protein n=1 Tax=Erwinia tasmaniensis TaxID=338565 RepID=UPI003A4E50BB